MEIGAKRNCANQGGFGLSIFGGLRARLRHAVFLPACLFAGCFPVPPLVNAPPCGGKQDGSRPCGLPLRLVGRGLIDQGLLLAGQGDAQVRVHAELASFAWSTHAGIVAIFFQSSQLPTYIRSQIMDTLHPDISCDACGCEMDMRELKGLEIAARCKLAFQESAWLVPSQSGNGKYKATLQPVTSCTCEDFSLNRRPCKHVHAARLVQERDHGGQAPAIDVGPSQSGRPTGRGGPPTTSLRPSRSTAFRSCCPTCAGASPKCSSRRRAAGATLRRARFSAWSFRSTQRSAAGGSPATWPTPTPGAT